MSVIFTMPPTSQSVSHTWYTTIQKSINGIEKRSALYTWPRITLDTSYITGKNSESNWIRNRFKQNIKDIWSIPIFPDRTTLTAPASAGTSTLTVVESDYRHFYEGRELVLVNPNDWTAYEEATISTVSGTTITIGGTLASSWSINTNVYPLYGCRIADIQKISKQIKEVDTWQIEFKESYETDRTFNYTIPTVSGTTYSGVDVFTRAPINSFEQSFAHPFDTFQYIGKGLSYSWYDSNETEISGEYEYIIGNAETETSNYYVREMFDLFDSKRGRWGSLWIPTWNKDIVLSDSSVGGADTTFNVENNGWHTYYSGNTTYGELGHHIIVWLDSDTYVIRKITGGSNTSMTLDGVIGAVSDTSKLYISFLTYSRFDVDEIKFNYITEDICKFKLDFAGLVKENIGAT